MATRGLALDRVGQPWLKWVIRGVAALVVSLAITLIYHVGYAEFRTAAVVAPLVGNLVITATYVVTGSPLAPIVTHVAMHVASVWLGMETLPLCHHTTDHGPRATAVMQRPVVSALR